MNKDLLKYIFKHMPTLECENIILRPMRVSDAEDMYDYAKRPDLTRYLLWSPHPSVAYSKEFLKFVVKRYRAGDFFDWGVEEKSSGRMIGTCGFTSIDLENGVGEIGYVINPDFSGRGYATEAARAVIEYGFGELSLHRIQCRFMKGNDASLRVAEKLGMTFEGYIRDLMYVKGAHKTIGYCSLMHDEFNYKAKENIN